jgi:UPF0042 nucleotide-binding protein
MSGAGKSLALNNLEDMGYFCVDNLPPQLLPELIKAYTHQRSDDITYEEPGRMAFGIDVRSAESFDEVQPNIELLEKMGVACRIIYLEAADHVLVNRYKESRRNHPLAQNRGLSKAIVLERERLEGLRGIASDIIDTTELSPSELRNKLYDMLSSEDRDERMTIFIQSFGFKYGIPVDCDCVLDVRFIPNPFYIKELKQQSGLDHDVSSYVLGFDETEQYLIMQEKVFEYTLPYYIREGKVRLTIGVGCTGGRHRSVAIAENLALRLRDNNLRVVVDHRDINKDPRLAKRQDAHI